MVVRHTQHDFPQSDSLKGPVSKKCRGRQSDLSVIKGGDTHAPVATGKWGQRRPGIWAVRPRGGYLARVPEQTPGSEILRCRHLDTIGGLQISVTSSELPTQKGPGIVQPEGFGKMIAKKSAGKIAHDRSSSCCHRSDKPILEPFSGFFSPSPDWTIKPEPDSHLRRLWNFISGRS